MKVFFSKIALILFSLGFLSSCNTVKRVPDGERLLVKNTVLVNGEKNKSERINNLLYQHKNRELLGVSPLRLHIYNLARPNIDSLLNANIDAHPKRRDRLERFLSKKQLNKYIASRVGFNQWLKKTGEAPTIINDEKTQKSERQLKAYFFHNGWFNALATSNVTVLDDKKAEITYNVTTGKPYAIDSLTTVIASPIIDSLYQSEAKASHVVQGKQYETKDFEAEKNRINYQMRNSGVYHFSEDYIFFENDTINTNHKVNVELQISNRKITSLDSSYTLPLNIYHIKDVNIYTDYAFAKKDQTPDHTTTYKGYNLYSYDKMRFKPKALTDAIFITPNEIFRDKDRGNSYRHLSDLRTFNYPDIEYIENPDTTLTANIYLTPKKRFALNLSAEAYQSNIQTVGFSFNPGLLIRNVFRGAETLEISALGSIGASKDAGDDRDRFFDINEIGANLKLTIPRLFFPFKTEKIIPKTMFPSTRISLSTTSQTNIGLDKQTLSGVFNYRWHPSNIVTNRLDLFNVQFVKNLNPDNYFGVYTNSFNSLNSIAHNINYNNGNALEYPSQTDAFIRDVLNGNTSILPNTEPYRTVSAINERKERLTEDNLIFATNFNYVRDNRETLYDETFSIFRAKLELAGNLFSTIASISGLDKNSNDRYEIFNVAYSQYAKAELDYVKHWDLGKKNVVAIRSFFGLAVPYGNATNIPFSKSFFAGGANDNRAWTAYSLGPGSSESNNEFNEANLKIALSAEQRFNIFGSFYGALFVDAGNIWNALDDVEDDKATFNSLGSLKDIAIGSGLGFRYDFGPFLLRLDIGFKTYDPSYIDQNRWFNDYNFKHAVYNIGINYPF
ncbi:MAG: BamA/TamA family outer membrane protein [Algicola sp.]|nr:BamA/TamA family outer membrane protein [Algicola sp.]